MNNRKANILIMDSRDLPGTVLLSVDGNSRDQKIKEKKKLITNSYSGKSPALKNQRRSFSIFQAFTSHILDYIECLNSEIHHILFHENF